MGKSFHAYPGALVRTAAVLVLTATLSACSLLFPLLVEPLPSPFPLPFEHRQWREEALLSSGEVITVSRSIVPGKRYWIPGSGNWGFEPAETLVLPDGTRWDERNSGLPSVDFDTIVLDRDDRSWIIIVSPTSVGGRIRMGCPVPNYVYLRSSGAGWSRVPPSDVPDGLALNMLPLMMTSNAGVGPTVSIARKREIHEAWLAKGRAEHARRTGSGRYGDGRYFLWEPMGYRNAFSKTCDPATIRCDEPGPGCGPPNRPPLMR